MPDSSDIDQALVDKLRADATLMALMPNGVWMDQGPPNAESFVIVSLVDATDEQMLGARAFESVLYQVKAVTRATGANIKSAAARIDTLLEGGTLVVTGYALMLMQREERVRATEVDEVDAALRWQHRGGRYRVMVAPS